MNCQLSPPITGKSTNVSLTIHVRSVCAFDKFCLWHHGESDSLAAIVGCILYKDYTTKGNIFKCFFVIYFLYFYFGIFNFYLILQLKIKIKENASLSLIFFFFFILFNQLKLLVTNAFNCLKTSISN